MELNKITNVPFGLFSADGSTGLGLLPGLIGIFLIAVIVIISVRAAKKPNSSGKLQSDNAQVADEEPIERAVKAKIVSVDILQNRYGNELTPTSSVVYFVTFQTEENKNVELCLREDQFEGCKIGDEGLLITLDDNFFAFGEGEDVPHSSNNYKSSPIGNSNYKNNVSDRPETQYVPNLQMKPNQDTSNNNQH